MQHVFRPFAFATAVLIAVTPLSAETRLCEDPLFQVSGMDRDVVARTCAVAAEAEGRDAKNVYMFYTTCPKCAKALGKNYVVGLAEI